VKEITRSSSAIVKIPYDEAYEEGFEDMQRRVPNLTRLVKLTGARPAGDLTEIIHDVVRSVTESQSSAANASPA